MAGPILVIGSNGFFGSWICRSLTAAGHEVVAGTRPGFDLTDATGLLRAVEQTGPAAVVNAAGCSLPAAAREDPAGCFSLNTGGTLNLLESVRRAAPETRLINLSSGAVYGPAGTKNSRTGERAPAPPDAALTEDRPLGATSPYAASKLAAEMLCGQYIRRDGLRITTLRVFNLIGPGQLERQAAAEFTLAVAGAIRRGEHEVRIGVGDPRISRDFTDVREAAGAIRDLIERAFTGQDMTGRFNLCSGRTVSLAELATALERAARRQAPGSKLTVSLEGDPERVRADEPDRLLGSPGKLERATGWSARIPFDRTVSDCLEASLDLKASHEQSRTGPADAPAGKS